MVIKRHLCGVHVAFDPGNGPTFTYECKPCFVTSRKREPCPACGQMMKARKSDNPGRAQGSHYSQQKRRIADSVFFLMSKATFKCKPLIFVATSPGFVGTANEPRFLKRFIDNLRNSYQMENYVWVREFTREGYPHFHFVANIPLIRGYEVAGQKIPFDPVKLSLSWSKYFGSDAKNSIRVGSKPDKHGRRRLYLSKNRRKAWYLCKYIGKSKGENEVRSGAKFRTFGMDQQTSNSLEPDLFRSRYPTEVKAMATWDNQTKSMVTKTYDVATGERIFENDRGELVQADSISWQRCGQHDVYIGFEKELITH
jgi:hypothetical protein